MTTRQVHQEYTPAVTGIMTSFHGNVVQEVQRAVAENEVVVVGMAWNPFVKKARKNLEKAGHNFKYLEYGNYLVGWKQRLAIKMWSGWPTFPQVFVRGVLLGGSDDLSRALADGSFQALKQKASSQA